MANQTTVVHVTHEAAGKVGGIGAVLEGLFTCNCYLKAAERSIITGPLFTPDCPVQERLGEGGEVVYSSPDGLANTAYAAELRKVEQFYNVGIVYGRRTFVDRQTGLRSSPEVLLIDVRYIKDAPINEFKKHLFEEFGIQSNLYEHLWEFEQYVRLAPPAIAALKAIGAAYPVGFNGGAEKSTTIIAHEFMGMPTALAAMLECSCDFRTIFYAHEVATMRRIVEQHPGHDTMFYNVIKTAGNDKTYVNHVFGDQNFYFKNCLIEASKHCDSICAVGDQVLGELRFLAPEFEEVDIDIVYNGIPAYRIGPADKLAAKEKLRLYCENLLGYKPDFVFTHVTRLVRSKGLWRDLRVLEHIEKDFRSGGKTAVMFLLSTEVSQRHSIDIYNMESAYNWPVAHREGWPDLSGGEADFYTAVQEFNAKSRNIKIIFVNQFGFQSRHCGRRMPENIAFMDIRKGTDVEFGQSVYEPFGISQLEPLTFGAICVISNVCGCTGFVRDVAAAQTVQIANPETVKNIIVADYTRLGGSGVADLDYLLSMGPSVREGIEANVSKKVAIQIIQRLPKNDSDLESMIQSGYSLAKNMSWEVVVRNYLLKVLQKPRKQQNQKIHTGT